MLCEIKNLYEARSDVTLTSYILDNSPEMLNGKKRPAVLICPGGGYMSCSDREGEPAAMAFAAMGYHAFVLRYSVYNEGGGFSMEFDNMPPKKHCVFPNPMRDIGKAMLYIKERADKWFLDADKIAVCGFSAGGHNCAMYSMYWDKPVMTNFFGVNADMLRPAVCILGYPVTDYLHMKASKGSNPFNKKIEQGATIAFFGTSEPDDEKYAEASPARLAGKNTPPMFIWATYEDSLVPVQQAVLLAAALAENKIPFEAHLFEGGRHGLSIATQASSGAKSEINDDAARWIDLCGAWLKKRFALDLPELRDFEK